MRPGIFVHSFRELPKHFHVLRAQIELPLGPPEIEALVLAQFASFVFAPMAAQFRLSGLRFYFYRLLCFAEPPCNDFTSFLGRIGKCTRMQVFAGPGAELCDNFSGV